MKSFLLVKKKPIILWGNLPDNIFFEGAVPEGFSLAISPSKGYVIIDVDLDIEKGKNGFLNIPLDLRMELENTFNYSTKRGGRHYWFKYTGIKDLGNKTSPYSIDLRTHRGYVRYAHSEDIRNCMHLVNETSLDLNKWLEELFSYI